MRLILSQLSYEDSCQMFSCCRRWKELVVHVMKRVSVNASSYGRSFNNESLRIILLRMTRLESLNLSSASYVTELGFQKLTCVLQLKELRLFDCRNIGILALKPLLSLRSLTELTIDASLQHYRENDGYVILYAKNTTSVLMQLTQFRTSTMTPVALHVYENAIQNYAPVFKKSLTHMQRLNLIRWSRMSHKLVEAWIAAFPTLSHFGLDYVVDASSVTHKVLKPISVATQLRSLSLRGNRLTDGKVLAALIDEAGERFLPLKQLFLDGNNKLSAGTMEMLCSSLTSLQSLSITDCCSDWNHSAPELIAHLKAFSKSSVEITCDVADE
jgi:hypothetical protein